MNQHWAHKPIGGNWYEASLDGSRPDWPALAGDCEVDVCVVGAGFAGLHSALSLAESGQRVCVLEQRQVGWAASGRNGGQALPEFACGPELFVDTLGERDGRQVWQLASTAARQLRQRIARYGIDCDYAPGHLEVAVSDRHFRRLAQRQSAQPKDRDDNPPLLLDRSALRAYIDSPLYHGGLYNPLGGHLHPLKLALGLARAIGSHGGTIHEHTTVSSWREDGPGLQVECGAGHTVRCRTLLLAANVGIGQMVHPEARRLSRRILPVGTWIIATAPLSNAQSTAILPSGAAVFDTRNIMDYFRLTRDRRLLFGGGSSYLGVGEPPRFVEQLQRRIGRVFPALEGVAVEHAWGGTLDISMNRAPDVGPLAAERRVFHVQGLSGSGIVSSCALGQVVADAINGERRLFDLMARVPHHNFPGGPWLRAPITAAGMLWSRLRDLH